MMLNRLNLADLDVPVIVAPMAGGPSTPELAAAATNAGGLGFIAAGLLPADAFAERIIAARKLTSGPLGVNLFGPQPSAGTVQGVRGRAGR
jgi:nitronate monooxygenase